MARPISLSLSEMGFAAEWVVPPRPFADDNLQAVGALTVRQVSAPC